jgi:transposase InsO family protein
VNRDVAAVIKAHSLIDIKTKPRHPESNGIVERFNGTVRADSDNDYGNNYLQAEVIIGKLIHRQQTDGDRETMGSDVRKDGVQPTDRMSGVRQMKS